MDDKIQVRKLIAQILMKQFTDSSIPTLLPTYDFLSKLRVVLCMKQIIFYPEWKNTEIPSATLFSSHDIYLRCVIFSCLKESIYHENVFENFISVCALLIFFNKRKLDSTGTNFRDLNIEVFMAIYDNVMKRDFCGKGGFNHLVEYIHGHRYLSWESKDLFSIGAATRDVILKDDEIKKELNGRDACTEQVLKLLEMTSIIMVQRLLATTSVELPTLPNNPNLIKDLKAPENEQKVGKSDEERIEETTSLLEDLNVESPGFSSLNSDPIKGLKASQKEEKAEKCEKERIMKGSMGFVDSDATSRKCSSSKTDHPINPDNNSASEFVDLGVTNQGCSSSNSDLRTDHIINQAVNKAPLGRMIRLVLGHYHDRFPSHANLDHHIQKKADGSM